jgi:hypothetical protein
MPLDGWSHCPKPNLPLISNIRRWAFLLQMPILAISFALVLWKVDVPLPSKQSAFRVKLARIDWLGSLTLVTAVGCLLVAVTLKTAEEMPWSSPAVWGLSVISVIALVSFVFVEMCVSGEPILPMRLLSQRTPACVAVSNFLLSFVGFSLLYNVPMYFTAVRLQTASQAGLHLLPNSVGSNNSG